MAEYRRRLPHFHPDGEHLFMTWRLYGSLPVVPPSVICATPGHAFAVEDRALARRHGRLWLSDARVARQVVDAIRTGESRKLYELHAWVIMPKRGSGRRICCWSDRGEPFWQHESWDHCVRDEREFHRIVAYIEENPVSAGLAGTPEGWPWSNAPSAS